MDWLKKISEKMIVTQMRMISFQIIFDTLFLIEIEIFNINPFTKVTNLLKKYFGY